jgi:hypothetical protein
MLNTILMLMYRSNALHKRFSTLNPYLKTFAFEFRVFEFRVDGLWMVHPLV